MHKNQFGLNLNDKWQFNCILKMSWLTSRRNCNCIESSIYHFQFFFFTQLHSSGTLLHCVTVLMTIFGSHWANITDRYIEWNHFWSQVVNNVFTHIFTSFSLFFSFSLHIRILFLLIEFQLTETLSLELTKIVIPSYRFHNEQALLECHYQLNSSKNRQRDYGSGANNGYRSLHSSTRNDNNGLDHSPYGRNIHDDDTSIDDEEETLYSVKWYKDNEEFYRYVPKANPPQRIYHNVDGVRVDVSWFFFSLTFFLLYSEEGRSERMKNLCKKQLLISSKSTRKKELKE